MFLNRKKKLRKAATTKLQNTSRSKGSMKGSGAKANDQVMESWCLTRMDLCMRESGIMIFE